MVKSDGKTIYKWDRDLRGGGIAHKNGRNFGH
jgi:hypothetical protein